MNITITGRHFDVSDSLEVYANKKIKKLETYFDQLIDAHVILHIVKLDHWAEVMINGDGVRFHGREKSVDMYAAIDLLFEKMEKQINKYKEKHSSHKVINYDKILTFDFTSQQGRDIVLNQVSNKPIDSIEAYLQMKVDHRDFILFKKGVGSVETDIDYLNRCYALICRDSNTLKMVEIPFENIKENNFSNGTFVEYELNVIDDSPVNPDIEFKKTDTCGIRKITLDEALDELESAGIGYIPFFNVESRYFNVVYKNGTSYEVMVPAF